MDDSPKKHALSDTEFLQSDELKVAIAKTGLPSHFDFLAKRNMWGISYKDQVFGEPYPEHTTALLRAHFLDWLDSEGLFPRLGRMFVVRKGGPWRCSISATEEYHQRTGIPLQHYRAPTPLQVLTRAVNAQEKDDGRYEDK